jgi:hypothetical protein
MFDPNTIGYVDASDIKVLHVLKPRDGNTSKPQIFKGVLTLQNVPLGLYFKVNVNEKRDQIVADRLKHLFGLQPLNCFALTLDFMYCDDELVSTPDAKIEYFAFQCPFEELKVDRQLPTFDEYRGPMNERFQIELAKILLFRYTIGTTKTNLSHILIRNELPISISECMISSSQLPNQFASEFEFITSEAWDQARLEFRLNFSNNKMRGILLQTRQVESDIKYMKPKGLLGVPCSRIAEIIEERLDVIAHLEAERLPQALCSGMSE